MGGMGMILTALATEQQRTGQVDVNVVLPYYSYLKHKRKGEELHRVADLVMYIQDKQQQPQQQSGATAFDSSPLSSSSYLSSSAYKSVSHESSSSIRESSESKSRSRSVLGTLTGDQDYTQQHQPQQQQWVPLEFRVTKWNYVTSPPPPAVNRTTWYIDDHGSNQTLLAGMQRPSLKHEKLAVYLIGPGNRTPFSMAFRARNPVEIYSSPKGLPQEWKDQYFLKAAATFLSFQASAASHDQSLFAPPSDLVSPSGVDVVHIHGATNAYLAHYLQDPTLWNTALPKPSVVYTMHDYLDELQYTNTVANVHRFDHSPPLVKAPPADLVPGSAGLSTVLPDSVKGESYDSPLVTPTIHGNRMFMSSLAIDLANVVTFVSQTMAIEMVEGRMDFYLKELVMDNVLRKAMRGRFFGVSNGVDYRHSHPFQSKRLAKAKLAYPTYAWQQLTTPGISTQQGQQQFVLSGNVTSDYVSAQKDRAKRWLIRKKFLSEGDKHRQIVLYVGRFQYNKGLASFERAIQAFIKHNMILVIIGQPNNYPLDQVKQWQHKYPGHVHVLTTAQEQKSWLMYVRAATDLVFVPSLTESFGLVAAEGLMFGCPVLSTGAGGLKEFLVDRQQGTTMIPAQSLETHPYNAYLYRLDQRQEATTEDSMDSLEKAIEDAARDYLYLAKHRVDRELFTLHMIDNALALGWRRRPKPAANNGYQQPLQQALNGPVYDYLRIYNLAIQDQYSKSNIGIKNSLLP
jgi:glycogen synthase